MDIQKVEEALRVSRKNGRGLVAEFNALQGIISALAFRSHVVDDDLYSSEFYMWYLQKLIDIRSEIVKHRNEAGPPYVLGSDWPERMTIETIGAILDCVPEVSLPEGYKRR
jgi:hypothetical protein